MGLWVFCSACTVMLKTEEFYLEIQIASHEKWKELEALGPRFPVVKVVTGCTVGALVCQPAPVLPFLLPSPIPLGYCSSLPPIPPLAPSCLLGGGDGHYHCCLLRTYCVPASSSVALLCFVPPTEGCLCSFPQNSLRCLLPLDGSWMCLIESVLYQALGWMLGVALCYSLSSVGVLLGARDRNQTVWLKEKRWGFSGYRLRCPRGETGLQHTRIQASSVTLRRLALSISVLHSIGSVLTLP